MNACCISLCFGETQGLLLFTFGGTRLIQSLPGKGRQIFKKRGKCHWSLPLESTLWSTTYVPGANVPRDAAVNRMAGKTKCKKALSEVSICSRHDGDGAQLTVSQGLPCPQGRADWSKLGQSDNRGLIRCRICLVSFFVSKMTRSCVFFHPEAYNVCCSSFFDVRSYWCSVPSSMNSLGVRETCQSAPRGYNQQNSQCRKLYSSHKPGFSIHTRGGWGGQK